MIQNEFVDMLKSISDLKEVRVFNWNWFEEIEIRDEEYERYCENYFFLENFP